MIDVFGGVCGGVAGACGGVAGSPRALEAAFGSIAGAFSPQQVDYSNTAYGKDHWQLSCFMEYEGGVALGKVDLRRGALMRRAAEPTRRTRLGLSDTASAASAHAVLVRSRGLKSLSSPLVSHRAPPDTEKLPGF